MKFGFSLVVRGADATPDTFRLMAEKAEALALDSLWLSAHVILPPQVDSHYNMVQGQAYPPHWRERYWEPFTVLGYLAAITERVTLGLSVLVLPMHHPIEVAKQAAEIDCLSGGRLVLGVGVGWFKEEFVALGRDFHTRGARTDEALDLMRRLWSDDPVTFEGRYHQVRDALFSPKPVQQPYPPVWIAGHSLPALRRAARRGDGWHPVRLGPDAYAEHRDRLAELLDAEGRSRADVSLSVKLPLTIQDGPAGEGQFPTQGRPGDIAEGIHRYAELGVEHLTLDYVPETCAVGLEAMERFCDEVRPLL